MSLKGKKIGILLESDFYEPEIYYYERRFAEEGIEVNFLTRLWGQEKLTFKGHEYQLPFVCAKSFENISDDELRLYSAIIIPAGMVSDRLRYTEDVTKLPPAAEFMKRTFENKELIKGIICHGMWLMSPVSDVIKGRKVVVHNNLISDARNMGLKYINEDIVVDQDLVTARTGDHYHLFARKIIKMIDEKQKNQGGK